MQGSYTACKLLSEINWYGVRDGKNSYKTLRTLICIIYEIYISIAFEYVSPRLPKFLVLRVIRLKPIIIRLLKRQ